MYRHIWPHVDEAGRPRLNGFLWGIACRTSRSQEYGVLVRSGMFRQSVRYGVSCAAAGVARGLWRGTSGFPSVPEQGFRHRS